MNLEPEDYVRVTVTLRTTPAENNASIKRDWRTLLGDWAKLNGCSIERIEWTRHRNMLVDTAQGLEVLCELVERSSDNKAPRAKVIVGSIS